MIPHNVFLFFFNMGSVFIAFVAALAACHAEQTAQETCVISHSATARGGAAPSSTTATCHPASASDQRGRFQEQGEKSALMTQPFDKPPNRGAN